jgi:very-short-patch-repair endonuclease
MNYSKITSDIFKERMIKIDSSYDYSKIDYKNMHKKVKVICYKHGEFEQTPINLLSGFLCKECKKDKSKQLKLKKVLKKSEKIHNYKYDYSLVEYNKMILDVTIICPIHGNFEQSLNNHINQKKGCPKCVKNFKLGKDDFVKKSDEIHNNFYDYSKSDFTTVANKVIIICPIHGDFPQTPNNHLGGVGCPTCSSSKGEKLISKILDHLNINYIKQKKFKDCKDKNCLPFDFYLTDSNVIIEYDGIQHFESFEIFGGYEKFLITKKHDEMKNEYCKNKNIKMIRISHKDNINEIINNNFKK